jgi:hypothetical protein
MDTFGSLSLLRTTMFLYQQLKCYLIQFHLLAKNKRYILEVCKCVKNNNNFRLALLRMMVQKARETGAF